jgi:polyisoprenoid-binding protein YceI
MRHSPVPDGLILILLGVSVPGGLLVAATPPPRAASSVGGQNASVPKPTAPAAPALKVDPGASRIYVKVGAEGYGHVHGVLGRLVSGTVGLAPGNAGELVLDLTTFVVDATEARQAFGMFKPVAPSDQQKITATMLGSEVLDVARYPRAVLAITAVVPLDGQPVGSLGRYRLKGKFTLHGVTRRLHITAKVEPADRPNTVRMRGEFAILQSDYGMKPYSALAGMVRVADRLEIRGDLMLGDPGR